MILITTTCNFREEMLTMLKTCLVRQGLEEDGDEGVKVRT